MNQIYFVQNASKRRGFAEVAKVRCWDEDYKMYIQHLITQTILYTSFFVLYLRLPAVTSLVGGPSDSKGPGLTKKPDCGTYLLNYLPNQRRPAKK